MRSMRVMNVYFVMYAFDLHKGYEQLQWTVVINSYLKSKLFKVLWT